MSSGDDLDEDEMLQMALKEQSNRDVNYHKMSQGKQKPVRNYVQPPGGAQQRQKGMGKQRKPSMDEDDDSDVEMLSISSGDEDDRGRVPPRHRAGAGKDDDSAWDGEEPDCWKRVDEAALARRVREMRDTRAVPVIIKIDRRPKGKGLTSMQSLPRGMEWVDPLGLGLINHKTFRLISDNMIIPPTTDVEPLDPSAREKLNYYLEVFDAKLFLSRVHLDTSAADLEAGALTLKNDLRGRTQQKKQLVKENFDCFVSCKTTIDDIESKMKRIEEDPEGAGTAHLFDCIQGVCSVANRALALYSRDRSKRRRLDLSKGCFRGSEHYSTCQVQSVEALARVNMIWLLESTGKQSLLFCLLMYGSVVSFFTFIMATSICTSYAVEIKVGILRRVLEEVEKVVHEFKTMLYKAMEDPNVDLTSNRKIRGLLEKCTLDLEARMENLQNELHERALSDAKWRQIRQDIDQSSAADYSLADENDHLAGDLFPEMTSEELDALRGRYIRQLTAVLIHHVPVFWKVALSVSSGKFAKSSQVAADSSANNPVNKAEDRLVDYLDEVAGMICNTLSAYKSKLLKFITPYDFSICNPLLRSSLHSMILKNPISSNPHMNDAIKEITKASRAFEAKESAPSIAVTVLRTLEFEISKIYILRLCSWMRTSTEDILKDESWVPVSILERNKSPYSISSLPLAFRAIMVSAMDEINAMLQSLQSESANSEDVSSQLQDIQESVRLAFLNCLLDFAGHLEHIGSKLTQNKSNLGSMHFQNGYSHSHEAAERSVDPVPGSIVDPHLKLLMVLSNIGYCRDELAHELYGKYKHIWLQSRGKVDEDSDIQDLVMSYSGLEEKVLEQYTLAKTNLIRSAAVNYLLDAGVQWGAAPAVKGVRDVAVDLLHTLVAVHAEVFAGCKPLLDKTLGILVEGLIDIFLGLFNENKTKDLRALDPNGFSQLMLERFMEQVCPIGKGNRTVTEPVETPSHQRRATRGIDDVLPDDRSGSNVSPDDLIALAQQHSSELLQSELERTRINTACFVESIPLDSVPESAKAAYASFRGGSMGGAMDSPGRSFRGSQSANSPSFRQRRR
ncbi:UNVERIFIED_CONTAM: Exocyst complex component SEC5A [Sesamum latifolium]|uniref:Exocyst complex component SEC5 n=1 Tax=Sesamum latifolium TaxID=2727402 RepID=A0AAW2VRB1_9LAMI